MAPDAPITEKQHAIIGKILFGKREAEKRLAVLKAEAAQLGDEIGSLSQYLRGNVHYVWFDGVSTNENYPHPHRESFSVADVDGVRIAKLTSDIRNAMDEIARFGAQARELGF